MGCFDARGRFMGRLAGLVRDGDLVDKYRAANRERTRCVVREAARIRWRPAIPFCWDRSGAAVVASAHTRASIVATRVGSSRSSPAWRRRIASSWASHRGSAGGARCGWRDSIGCPVGRSGGTPSELHPMQEHQCQEPHGRWGRRARDLVIELATRERSRGLKPRARFVYFTRRVRNR